MSSSAEEEIGPRRTETPIAAEMVGRTCVIVHVLLHAVASDKLKSCYVA